MAATPLNSFKNQKTIDIVAANVRHYRNLRNLSQMELAVACDTHTRQIQRIEYGHTDTKLSMLQTLADQLNITLAELVTKR